LGARVAGLSPVVVTVSRIRQELQRAAGTDASAAGVPTTALLGRIFHESFAVLMGPDSNRGWRHALRPRDLEETEKLREHVYTTLAGPRLRQYSAALRESTAEVLAFWHAVSDMCEWIRGMLATAQAKGIIAYDGASEEWQGASRIVAAERELCLQLRRPDWTRPVRVVGVADAVWHKPESGDWCVVEYKLGRTSPEADLCQACLYHELLRAGGDSGSMTGSLGMLRFLPELDETFYPPEALAGAREPLIRLIGRLAGVSGTSIPPESVVPPPAQAVRPISAEHEELGRALLKVLDEFGSPARIEGDPIVGPTFIRFVLDPEKRIRAGGILKQALDLQVRLRLDAAPIIHVDKGRLVVDLQRKDRQVVSFSSIRDQLPAPNPQEGSSLVPVGVNLAGLLHFASLSNPVNAHILVAGASGSGKSEWLRSALAGLLLSNTPETLRLVLIDPKRNAFTDLKGSPYLFRPDSIIYPPEHSATEALGMLIDEMESRYRDFEKCEADDLERYIRKSGDRKPRIVCVCDEYADLVSADKAVRREIELAISRLGAKARAAGIHLIVATQRPSRDIVAGTLKANMSCKVALKTQSAIESRLILEEAGAENLLGHGDLLFCDIGNPIRLQSPYLAESERAEIFRQ
jgi:S-DNA-T family DNA segregation ATPase FtsK/SpoIIIE